MTYNNPPVGNTHVKYEPTSRGGPHEVTPGAPAHEPLVSGRVQRHAIGRQNNRQQAAERYRTFEPWESDESIKNLVGQLSKRKPDIQDPAYEPVRRGLWSLRERGPVYRPGLRTVNAGGG
jgi:catalase